MLLLLLPASFAWTPELRLAPTWVPRQHSDAALAQCDASSFPSDLGDTQCHGLRKVGAQSEGECCAACLADAGGYGCTTYGWCPKGESCDTQQKVAGCWIGTSAKCRASSDGWVARRRALPPLSDDYFYTHFHPQPLKNWLNDPNGPMYFNGMYHVAMRDLERRTSGLSRLSLCSLLFSLMSPGSNRTAGSSSSNTTRTASAGAICTG